MSTRYVWGRYNIETEYELKIQTGTITRLSTTIAYVGTGYTFNESNQTISLVGAVKLTDDEDDINPNGANNGQFPLSTYPYMAKSISGNTTIYTASSSGTLFWGFTDEHDEVCCYRTNSSYFPALNGFNTCTVKTSTVKGSLNGYVSSANSRTYPNDSISGSYWYEYQGQDNIDPSGCVIPSTIMGGSQIQITVTPGTGKLYSGTVSYIYQVKLGSGSWQTIQTTTATSVNYTVPYGTETIQVRVQAKDDIGFTSADYVASSTVTVINNQPPTAPGSIQVTGVLAGQQCTITLTAATDPDGEVVSYIYERSVDGSAWQQFANVNSLTQTDQVSGDWGTVAYRACAVDDDGATGPYVTGETTTVNSGWLIISGPANDMGDKPAPFDFEFSINATGASSIVSDIAVTVTLDGEVIYTGTPDAGEEISLPMDTRLMRAGEHIVQIAATKEDYLEVNGTYTFDVPFITLPDGGRAEQLQNKDGDVIFPYTLARLVIGKDGKDVNELIDWLLDNCARIQTGTYTGTGTFGANNRNSLTFDFVPKMVFITLAGAAGLGANNGFLWCGDPSVRTGVSVEGKTFTWYAAANAATQLNTSGSTYYYAAIGDNSEEDA